MTKPKRSYYLATGVYYNSDEKFRTEYPFTTEGYFYAMHINLWRGNVYSVVNGKRTKIKEVHNC